MEGNIMNLEAELDFLQKTQEDHLDDFDIKFEQISEELRAMKSENLSLKEREKQTKRRLRDADEFKEGNSDRLQNAERLNDELTSRLFDLEREVRAMINEREREVKDNVMRTSMETRSKQENKAVMLDDIQNLIKQFKSDKKVSKSQFHSMSMTSADQRYLS